MEKFVDIEGYEGNYQVSNYGNTKSLNYKRTGKEKLLKPWINSGGYLLVNLCKEGKLKMKRIHRLVAEAFLPNPHGYTEVNHKDEDKTNNSVENLEWCDSKYNNNYGTRNKRVAEANSKKVYQYTLDGMLAKIWPSAIEAGRNGFSEGHITECCNGKRKTHKSYRWSYAPL